MYKFKKCTCSKDVTGQYAHNSHAFHIWSEHKNVVTFTTCLNLNWVPRYKSLDRRSLVLTAIQVNEWTSSRHRHRSDFTPAFLPQAPKKAKRRQAAGDGGSSNVFSMFEQSQIQEYKEVRSFLLFFRTFSHRASLHHSPAWASLSERSQRTTPSLG